MSGSSRKLMGTTAAGADFLAVEDVFSTFLYTGTSVARTITNGIDLAGEGGLVWLKWRSGANSVGNQLFTTDLGAGNYLTSNAGSPLNTGNTTQLNAFNSDGFSLGNSTEVNYSGDNYASWTFRKAPRFFDVVTYTGTGVAGLEIAHDLGVDPGFIVVKKTSDTGFWRAFHRSLPDHFGNLDLSSAFFSGAAVIWGNGSVYVAPTSTNFTVGSDHTVNSSGQTYVAYLFAHNDGDGEFGPDGDADIIKCGSYTGNGADDGPTISLGWEPQWLLIKRSAGGTGEWILVDTMRGMTADGNVAFLEPNTPDAEVSNNYVRPTADGFKLTATGSVVNASGSDYIYIAIRRGPMRAPTSGTEVFAMDTTPVNATASTPTFTAGFPVDLGIRKKRDGSDGVSYAGTRLLGDTFLEMSATSAETANSFLRTNGYQDGFGFYNGSGQSSIGWMFRRAPGFFDVVAYSGNDTARTIQHNLGVVPEMIWVKSRSAISNWSVLHSGLNTAGNEYIRLNLSNAKDSNVAIWNGTVPTDTVFSVGTSDEVNHSYLSATYIAYLFATLPGVSKVGSYTGNGSSQTIDCGFTSGARFILIKRTDNVSGWAVHDTARGIVAGADNLLFLNDTQAEFTTHDTVDPESSGFIVNEVATGFNASGGNYIFLAIA